MRKLFWFRNDLRLHDNPGLDAQARIDGLLLVYCWPVNRPWCNVTGLGAQRERFLLESLQALRQALRDLGQDLLLVQGSPELVIPELVRDYRIDAVVSSKAPGYYERRTTEHLQQTLPVPLELYDNATLFTQAELPFSLSAMPDQFTPFRQLLDEQRPGKPAAPLTRLPPPPAARFDSIPAATATAPPALPLRGGSPAGQRRLRQFVFDQQGIRQYKQTRNCLDGLSGSSTLSPWLANGCISARQVAAAIADHEQRHGGNDSTYWLYFELLWREFFHWRARRDDISLFRAGNHRRKLHNCSFEPRAFARWCAGDTEYPIVNAVMRQLVATGWASNRGRQIAASCLVNELKLDWRYGAAFFEKHLIDYDVASNYGNWQYLAGVGADPRGGRHFDLDKQTREHDPDGIFIEQWGGRRPSQPEFVTDAADWPIREP
ncbi:DASH family cryptochrome [Seongchinamella sediminis]|uniref:Cryptochrome DASH n=1 Tax=Seongchinamella sediminis TaxID=2283635 RepID=A0A3L7E0C9_9GAMM|nr:DASH family cryptochrome [Seongchinamella sediminis]RLQ21843.1 DASH family cryptochrome [Seongchinamella sediminis]